MSPESQSFGLCATDPFTKLKVKEAGGLKGAIEEANDAKMGEMEEEMYGAYFYSDPKYGKPTTEVEGPAAARAEYVRVVGFNDMVDNFKAKCD